MAKVISPLKLAKDTTVGRAILWMIVPKGLPYALVNQPLGKKLFLKC